MSALTDRDATILKLGRNRRLAHQSLFRHRHGDETPEFHTEMIDLWHSRAPRVSIMAFREGGKSTVAEEAFVIGADYKLFHNAIIVGSTEKRAVERLRAIKYEFETNEFNEQLFGKMQGAVWNEAEVILANGVRIMAVGRGQSLRGTKHLHYRPDFCFCDDIEEVEKGQIYSDEEAEETLRWFMKVLVPSLDKAARIRVNATPLSRNSLPMVLARQPDWVSRVYPIEHIDAEGERRATWPARYPLPWIDDKKAAFARVGLLQDFMQEYMCVAEDAKQKVFTPEMIRVKPVIRTWQPTYAFYDPARTTKASSATTGWAVWSWVGSRMVVWDGGGDLWKPDELIDHIFRTDAEYGPVLIGVERDGLEEFLLQPLRHEMLRRGRLLPLDSRRAPKGKLAFIEGLQPYFNAHEITFAKDIPVLRDQFLGFPHGRIDGPNALAYAPLMRPGQVIYEDFTAANVVEQMPARQGATTWLALNATQGLTTGALVQVVDGGLHVLADFVREGDPGAVLAAIVREAGTIADRPRLVAGPEHFTAYDTVGLRGAVAKLPAELRRGAPALQGRDELRAAMQRQHKGQPSFLVSTAARWTLNALCAGFAREVGRDGKIMQEPRQGVYSTIILGIESLSGMMKVAMVPEQVNHQRTPDGRSFISALPSGETRDAKADWGVTADFGALVGRG